MRIIFVNTNQINIMTHYRLILATTLLFLSPLQGDVSSESEILEGTQTPLTAFIWTS